jgi:hypothetical protein
VSRDRRKECARRYFRFSMEIMIILHYQALFPQNRINISDVKGLEKRMCQGVFQIFNGNNNLKLSGIISTEQD